MDHDHEGNSKWSPVSKYVFGGFVLIVGYFLITEHRAHVVQYLPFLLLAACPLMHLFHGHGGHGGEADDKKSDATSRPKNQSPEQPHHH